MPPRLQGASRKSAQESHARSGAWLRELRERQGLTQRQLAHKVGAESYTIIAQFEHGRGDIPAHRLPAWAQALGIEPHELSIGLVSRRANLADGAPAARPRAQVYWLHPRVATKTE
jgi:transcriptional regulator with XRE-family HTH domain